ncbi:regulatory protein RecX [Qipengyuania sediminis]|uniref:regulatory protein RecX n=1 Tax=Qipengyuania sediminis TaxID=1532023 RepID=UPI001059E7AF|nr:RecX family transcriptional regulator [Qipengyuania sediminis]
MDRSQPGTAKQARGARRAGSGPPPPLDAARLEELALAYVARFAASAGRLAAYCRRKLRERGHVGAEEGAAPPDVSALVERFVEAGYVDDAGFARARSDSLLRRGYGARRVGQALRADGIGEDLRAATAPQAAARREAAAAYARRRRFGPYARDTGSTPDPRQREKHLAALLRAGHDAGDARRVLAAASDDEVEAWIAEAREEEGRL